MTNADHEIEDFIRAALDARRALEEVLPRALHERERFGDGSFRVRCSTCGCAVSNPLPFPVIVRALVVCVECTTHTFPDPTGNTQHERQAPMSPTYLDRPVSDEYMQGLVEGYRDGQRLQGGEEAVEDSDQPIIDRLTEEKVITERKAVALGFYDAKGKGVEE